MKPANYPGGGYYVPENQQVVIDGSCIVGPSRIQSGEVYTEFGEKVGARLAYTTNGHERQFVVITMLSAEELLLGVDLLPIPPTNAF